MSREKAILALSGGIDSTTVLSWLLANNYDVLCCLFYYGSKHNRYELAAAHQVYIYYKNMLDYRDRLVACLTIDLSSVFEHVKSNLLKGQGTIPEGYYTDESMKQTVVPSRNIIFLSVLSALAESHDANTVAIGIHQGDHVIYPDCRPLFFHSMQRSIDLGTAGRVKAIAPFLFWDKTEIVKYGLDHKVPYHLTRTCYKDQDKACGKCGSCVERLEAFRLNGVTDPIKYETR